MAQVVTNDNIQEFMENGRVDEFKPPVPRETEPEVVTTEAKVEAKEAPKGEDDDDKDLTEKVRQKIGKKHREKMEAEEFAEQQYNERRAAEKRADQLEAQLKDMQEKSRPAPVEAIEPKQEDFATVQDYIKAMVAFNLKIERDAERKKSEQERQEQHALKVQNEFAASLEAMSKKYADFEDVTAAANITLPTVVTEYLLESDSKAELGYKLAVMYRDDRAELNRILNLSPIRAIAELGKLEAGLEKKPDAAKPEVAKVAVSKAPAPITPIEGKSAPVNPDLNRDMPYAEYKLLKAQKKR